MSDPIVVEIPGGQSVEFPAGTSIETIERSLVDYYKSQQQYSPEVPVIPPEGSGFVQTPPKDHWESFKRDLPANIGGIAYPLLMSKGGLLGRAGMALLGGATGEAVQQTYEGMQGQQKTPLGVAAEIGKAGAREGAFEGGSGLVLKGFDAARRGFTPSIVEGGGKLVEKFRQYGGQLTAPQVSDSWSLRQLEGLSGGSITGSGVLERIREQGEKAYIDYAKSLPTEVASKARSVLSDQEIGQLFIDTVRGGRSAHSRAAGAIYEELDRLIAPTISQKTVSETVETGLVDGAGNALTRTVPKQVDVIVGGHPVATGKLKGIADEYAARYARISNVGAGKVNKDIIEKVRKLDDNLLFKDAHNLRSELLAMQREIQQDVGAGKAKVMLNKLVSAVEGEMDVAANRVGGDILEAYKLADNFWKRGKKIFDDKFIADLAISDKKTAETIGDVLFRDGKVSEILKARKAIKASTKMTGKGNSQEIWHNMQAGYLEKLLNQNVTKEGTVNSRSILKAFTDRRKNRTLNAVFTKAQRDKIAEFAAIGERIQAKPSAGLGMVMNLTQAGTIAGMVAFDPSKLVSAETALILGTPRVIAHMLTQPKLVDKMIRASKTPANTTAGYRLSMELTNALNKIAMQYTERELTE